MQRAARTAAAAAMHQVVYVTAETHGWQEYDGAMESNPQGITRVMQAPIADMPHALSTLQPTPCRHARCAQCDKPAAT